MKLSLPLLAAFGLVLILTAGNFAQSASNPQEHQQGHGAMPGMAGPSIMLGEQTVDGVRAMAHLVDTGATMAQMGRKENYHLMLTLTDLKTGAAIDQATVAVKITEPGAGQPGEPIPLVGMAGHFGADLTLAAKGDYHLVIGSKLADGSKRQFAFSYQVK